MQDGLKLLQECGRKYGKNSIWDIPCDWKLRWGCRETRNLNLIGFRVTAWHRNPPSGGWITTYLGGSNSEKNIQFPRKNNYFNSPVFCTIEKSTFYVILNIWISMCYIFPNRWFECLISENWNILCTPCLRLEEYPCILQMGIIYYVQFWDTRFRTACILLPGTHVRVKIFIPSGIFRKQTWI